MERRYLTQAEVKAQHEGGRYIGIGIWIDLDGHVHFSVPEILVGFGLEDTAENRRLVVDVLELSLSKRMEVVQQEAMPNETPQ